MIVRQKQFLSVRSLGWRGNPLLEISGRQDATIKKFAH